MWRELHVEAVQRLESAMEARWLVEELADGAWPGVLDAPVTVRAARRFFELLERRATGEPFQYVVGHWPFRTLDLMVDGRVLIPRPETEVVVDAALAELDGLVSSRDRGSRGLGGGGLAGGGLAGLSAAGGVAGAGGRSAGGGVAVDLGTGSGAIALSLVAERSGVEVWATDASSDALAVARANLAGLGGPATRVRLAEGSWWEALPATLAGRVDLAVANPPYISSAEIADLDPAVSAWEPLEALEAGPLGTEDVEEILAAAHAWLAPRSSIVMEIGAYQAGDVKDLAFAAGFDTVEVRPDLAGRDRVLVARRMPA